MRFVRHGLVFLISIYFSLISLVGCAHFYRINFMSKPCIIPDAGYNYQTCRKMKVTIDDKEYIVPKSFVTDLASIPRFLWPVLAPQYSSFVAPAILHDYLYRCHNSVSRQFADDVLYSALITQNVSAFTASKFFLAVRLFGRKNYSKNNNNTDGCL